uniref:NADH-ubiquinone oxidoreductase chain 6 n=1 Tax=Lariscus insignis TaxID=226558 RepID=A0A171EBI5_9SCIU|nr:NADH dehydrogenase subunit 6 [Lariscus insignis]ALP86351.1 NADH dehydrogenase subunit 6 [Lariscus insignis]
MTNLIYTLAVIFVLGFVWFSSKPSPIYGGLGLVVSGGVGCGIVLYLGGSFLGLVVFLIYLGGMLVVFGYTTAMATEEYPEAWGPGALMFGMLLFGLLVEFLILWYSVLCSDVEIVVEFNSLGDWVMIEEDGLGTLGEDSLGVAALYSYGCWLTVVAGWSLFVGIFIAIEITRGN